MFDFNNLTEFDIIKYFKFFDFLVKNGLLTWQELDELLSDSNAERSLNDKNEKETKTEKDDKSDEKDDDLDETNENTENNVAEDEFFEAEEENNSTPTDYSEYQNEEKRLDEERISNTEKILEEQRLAEQRSYEEARLNEEAYKSEMSSIIEDAKESGANDYAYNDVSFNDTPYEDFDYKTDDLNNEDLKVNHETLNDDYVSTIKDDKTDNIGFSDDTCNVDFGCATDEVTEKRKSQEIIDNENRQIEENYKALMGDTDSMYSVERLMSDKPKEDYKEGVRYQGDASSIPDYSKSYYSEYSSSDSSSSSSSSYSGYTKSDDKPLEGVSYSSMDSSEKNAVTAALFAGTASETGFVSNMPESINEKVYDNNYSLNESSSAGSTYGKDEAIKIVNDDTVSRTFYRPNEEQVQQTYQKTGFNINDSKSDSGYGGGEDVIKNLKNNEFSQSFSKSYEEDINRRSEQTFGNSASDSAHSSDSSSGSKSSKDTSERGSKNESNNSFERNTDSKHESKYTEDGKAPQTKNVFTGGVGKNSYATYNEQRISIFDRAEVRASKRYHNRTSQFIKKGYTVRSSFDSVNGYKIGRINGLIDRQGRYNLAFTPMNVVKTLGGIAARPLNRRILDKNKYKISKINKKIEDQKKAIKDLLKNKGKMSREEFASKYKAAKNGMRKSLLEKRKLLKRRNVVSDRLRKKHFNAKLTVQAFRDWSVKKVKQGIKLADRCCSSLNGTWFGDGYADVKNGVQNVKKAIRKTRNAAKRLKELPKKVKKTIKTIKETPKKVKNTVKAISKIPQRAARAARRIMRAVRAVGRAIKAAVKIAVKVVRVVVQVVQQLVAALAQIVAATWPVLLIALVIIACIVLIVNMFMGVAATNIFELSAKEPGKYTENYEDSLGWYSYLNLKKASEKMYSSLYNDVQNDYQASKAAGGLADQHKKDIGSQYAEVLKDAAGYSGSGGVVYPTLGDISVSFVDVNGNPITNLSGNNNAEAMSIKTCLAMGSVYFGDTLLDKVSLFTQKGMMALYPQYCLSLYSELHAVAYEPTYYECSLVPSAQALNESSYSSSSSKKTSLNNSVKLASANKEIQENNVLSDEYKKASIFDLFSITAYAATGDAHSETLTGGDVAEQIVEYMKGKGWGNKQIAGLLANIYCECSMNPDAYENGRGSQTGGYGLCQWTRGRRTLLVKKAASLGVSISDISFQLSFIFDGDDPSDVANAIAYSNMVFDTASAAAEKWMCSWEKCSDTNKAKRRDKQNKIAELANLWLEGSGDNPFNGMVINYIEGASSSSISEELGCNNHFTLTCKQAEQLNGGSGKTIDTEPPIIHDSDPCDGHDDTDDIRYTTIFCDYYKKNGDTTDTNADAICQKVNYNNKCLGHINYKVTMVVGSLVDTVNATNSDGTLKYTDLDDPVNYPVFLMDKIGNNVALTLVKGTVEGLSDAVKATLSVTLHAVTIPFRFIGNIFRGESIDESIEDAATDSIFTDYLKRLEEKWDPTKPDNQIFIGWYYEEEGLNKLVDTINTVGSLPVLSNIPGFPTKLKESAEAVKEWILNQTKEYRERVLLQYSLDWIEAYGLPSNMWTSLSLNTQMMAMSGMNVPCGVTISNEAIESLIIPDNGSNNAIVYMAQGGGQEWSAVAFGDTNIAGAGCSITSLAMVVSYLESGTDRSGWVFPSDIRDMIAIKTGNYNKFHEKGAGQRHEIIPTVCSWYGYTVRSTCGDDGCSNRMTESEIISELAAGHPVIARCGPGIFTKKGHFIVLTGVTENGLITVNDPSHPNYCNQGFTWAEIKYNGNATCFWAISND